MAGFVGPRDVFRNPEALFRFFEPTTEGPDRWKETGDSPFELVLTHSGDDFAVMGMHFKLGLYEHQSAGALQGLIDLLVQHPALLSEDVARIQIVAYEPAYGIIGNPMKMDPRTRQSADHSMAYIVATMLRKAREAGSLPPSSDEAWKALMLTPFDYSRDAVFSAATRSLMQKVEFLHGGLEYDVKYPDGIPTSVRISLSPHGGRGSGVSTELDSGLVMYPAGHARNQTADLHAILRHKWRLLGEIALGDAAQGEIERLEGLATADARGVADLYASAFVTRPGYEDKPDASADD
jgi:2-methylcitrate dehydratase